jgi:uncharacterized damage-inducible protein DinB
MLATFESCFRILRDLHADIEAAIDGLPPEALDWTPAAEMNSMGVLIVHLTGAERYWIGDVAMGEPSGRDRDAEFRARGLDAAALKARLAETLRYAGGAFERLALSDLERRRLSPMHGEAFPVAWAVAHALEHTATHLGHIQIMRQLWQQRPMIGSG